jgi:hypothetical protein
LRGETGYLVECDGCGSSASHSERSSITAVDRRTGKKVPLVAVGGRIGGLAQVDDHIYYSISDNVSDGVYLLSKTGGTPLEVKFDGTPWFGGFADFVRYKRGTLVVGRDMVGWIPVDNLDVGTVRYRSKWIIDSAVMDDDVLYVAEYKDGYIWRVSHSDGDKALFGPLKSPAEIAMDGDMLFVVLRDSGDMYGLPKTGGDLRVIARVEAPLVTGSGTGVWARPEGLYWLRDGKLYLFRRAAVLACERELATSDPRGTGA